MRKEELDANKDPKLLEKRPRDIGVHRRSDPISPQKM